MQSLSCGTVEHATCDLYFLCIRIHVSWYKARGYTENTSDAWHIPLYSTRKHCITSMYCVVNQNVSVYVQ